MCAGWARFRDEVSFKPMTMEHDIVSKVEDANDPSPRCHCWGDLDNTTDACVHALEWNPTTCSCSAQPVGQKLTCEANVQSLWDTIHVSGASWPLTIAHIPSHCVHLCACARVCARVFCLYRCVYLLQCVHLCLFLRVFAPVLVPQENFGSLESFASPALSFRIDACASVSFYESARSFAKRSCASHVTWTHHSGDDQLFLPGKSPLAPILHITRPALHDNSHTIGRRYRHRFRDKHHNTYHHNTYHHHIFILNLPTHGIDCRRRGRL